MYFEEFLQTVVHLVQTVLGPTSALKQLKSANTCDFLSNQFKHQIHIQYPYINTIKTVVALQQKLKFTVFLIFIFAVQVISGKIKVAPGLAVCKNQPIALHLDITAFYAAFFLVNILFTHKKKTEQETFMQIQSYVSK